MYQTGAVAAHQLFTAVYGLNQIIKRYKHEDVKTPLECLVLLSENNLVTLKQGITVESLQAQARLKTDLLAAQEMQRAKSKLFASFVKPKRRV